MDSEREAAALLYGLNQVTPPPQLTLWQKALAFWKTPAGMAALALPVAGAAWYFWANAKKGGSMAGGHGYGGHGYNGELLGLARFPKSRKSRKSRKARRSRKSRR